MDFEGLKKYPKSLQIASFITNFYIYEGKINKIDYIIEKFNLVDNKNYIMKLIIYRIIKTLVFFENQLKEKYDETIKNKEIKLYNSLIEILNRRNNGNKRLL